MRIALRVWLALLALAPIGGLAWAGECLEPRTADDPALAAAMDRAIDAAVGDGFAGGVAIMKKGEVAYARVVGFSDSGGTAPVTGKTLFHVASVTKYLTAILVLKSAELGRLSLDDPISIHFPDTEIGASGATIRAILAHRSGLGSSYAAERETDADAAVAAIDAAFAPNPELEAFRYSNDGYDLLAIVIERVFGERFENVARRLVLEPACVSDFGFWGETELSDARKVGQPLKRLNDALVRRNYGMIGSAGFLTTALGLARLESALSTGAILSTASLFELRAPRGEISIGQAAFGSFLMRDATLGPFVSARGFEDWGDNAVVNHYLEADIVVSVTTSKGPREGEGEPFRDRLSRAAAEILAGRHTSR